MDRDELSKVASMEAMREAWTDDRLDDLANRMDHGFDRVDRDVRELRAEMKAGFERVDREIADVRTEMQAGFDRVDDEIREVRTEMKAGFDRVETRFEARFDAMHHALHGLQRTMLQIGGGLIGTLLVVTAGVLASHL
jgi:AcrR family transcriptional regulator